MSPRKSAIDSFRRVVSKYDSLSYAVLFFNRIQLNPLESFNYDTKYDNSYGNINYFFI